MSEQADPQSVPKIRGKMHRNDLETRAFRTEAKIKNAGNAASPATRNPSGKELPSRFRPKLED
ncbi:hypothetical protein [uncultured Sulfitobacter sp.]|uniref:hypothetical protein n=1 Tax=uncultured Sulfitobacter sp. TaxID=191468 RepID=UPI00260E91AA|nr:hypothetical protein [uncultured Sulfitobacter sp.]